MIKKVHIFVVMTLVIAVLVCSRGGGSQVSVTMKPKPTGARFVLEVDPRAHDYNQISSGLAVAGICWELIGIAILCRMCVAPKAAKKSVSKCRNPLAGQAIVFITVSICLTIWRLPVGYAAYLHDRSYGFATQSVWLWLLDRGRSWLFGLIQIPAVWIGYWLVSRSPKKWWMWLGLVLIPAQIAMAVLWPIIVDPTFNHFTPLAEGNLRRRIHGLAAKVGIPTAEILVADVSKRTTRINAYVSGIGPTKRIVIWDNTLKTLSEGEVVAIVAHELGHYRLGHIWIKIAEGTVGAFVLLGLLHFAAHKGISRLGNRLGIQSITDIGGYPLVLFILQLMLVIQLPVANYLSRSQEREADLFGLQLNRDGGAMMKTYGTFVKRDFADADPPAWVVFMFYTHPTIRDRIKMASDFVN